MGLRDALGLSKCHEAAGMSWGCGIVMWLRGCHRVAGMFCCCGDVTGLRDGYVAAGMSRGCKAEKVLFRSEIDKLARAALSSRSLLGLQTLMNVSMFGRQT